MPPSSVSVLRRLVGLSQSAGQWVGHDIQVGRLVVGLCLMYSGYVPWLCSASLIKDIGLGLIAYIEVI